MTILNDSEKKLIYTAFHILRNSDLDLELKSYEKDMRRSSMTAQSKLLNDDYTFSSHELMTIGCAVSLFEDFINNPDAEANHEDIKKNYKSYCHLIASVREKLLLEE